MPLRPPGIKEKLIGIFILIKVAPLVVLAWFAWSQIHHLVELAAEYTSEMVGDSRHVIEQVTTLASENSIRALDERSREAIERLTTDTALQVAAFLYDRDMDILTASRLEPNGEAYRRFLSAKTRPVSMHEPWIMDERGEAWIPISAVEEAGPDVTSANKDNSHDFHYRRPARTGAPAIRPLYLEMTFVDPSGRETIKVGASDVLPDDPRDISKKENTWCKAETYFPHLAQLEAGDIYVSEVIGPYLRGHMIGAYTRVRARKTGMDFAPGESGYAGKENPVGKRFQGLVRWATPVVVDGERRGWVTLALDHTHLMEFTDHLVPTEERYSPISDAASGNYAFMWDYKSRNISHPRDYFICGYDPETGEPAVPWLSEGMYAHWKDSGLGVGDWEKVAPRFLEQSLKKKPSAQLIEKGFVALDCRWLNFAPQCTGWRNLTQYGGSGSFLIFWSGLWKLTTAAAIPYYTGIYGRHPRGFGYVTIGANVHEFHKAAADTAETIDSIENDYLDKLEKRKKARQNVMESGLRRVGRDLTLYTMIMIAVVILIAIWIASALTERITTIIDGIRCFQKGEMEHRLEVKSRDEMGQLARAFNKMADNLHRTMEEIKEAKEKYLGFFKNSLHGIFQSAPDGGLLSVNPSMARMMGFDSADQMTAEINDVGSQLYMRPEKRDELVRRVMKEGKATDFEVQLRRKDGSSLWTSINCYAVDDRKGGGFLYIEGAVIDISARKDMEKAEKALRESEAKLARSRKMESLGLLAGGVAHDLNNVLSGIVSYPELILLELPDDSKLRKPIEAMQSTGHKAAAIVQDLLTMARGAATTREPLNLNAIVEEYLRSPEFEKLEQHHPNVAIRADLSPELLNVNGSHVHIAKVVMNLVSNAAEAVESLGVVVISTMNRYMDRPMGGYDNVTIGEYAVLSVSDDGPGISADDLERIFEPFYTKKEMGRSGTGLGLAVVWNVVQDHRGYVDVIADGNGAAFELYFPITREESSDKDLAIPLKDYMGNGETILVVDDEGAQREIACEMLSKLGYAAEAVAGGEEALAYLKERPADLLLLDMIMDPGMNGRETYEKVLRIRPGQKAVIASGYAETNDVKETREAGAGKYIKKPMTLEKLGMAIRNELKK